MQLLCHCLPSVAVCLDACGPRLRPQCRDPRREFSAAVLYFGRLQCASPVSQIGLGWIRPMGTLPPGPNNMENHGGGRVPHLVPGTHPGAYTVFMRRAARRFDPHAEDHNRHGFLEGQTRFSAFASAAYANPKPLSIDLYYWHGSRPLFDHESQRC